MPIYDYKCKKCGHQGEYITAMNDYEKCPKCNIKMDRLLHSRYGINMGACGAYGYYDDTLESYVSTEKQRKELMRKRNVYEHGGTPKTGPTWV